MRLFEGVLARAGCRRLLSRGICLVAVCWVAAAAAQDPVRDPAAPASALNGSLPSNIPVKRDSESTGTDERDGSWWVAVLLIGCVLAGGAVFVRRQTTRGAGSPNGLAKWMKGRGRRDTARASEVQRLSSTRLTPEHSLHVVVWEGRRLLLGCSGNGIGLLAGSEAPPDPTDTSPGPAFSPASGVHEVPR